MEFESAYLPKVKAELENMGFTKVTRLEHNHTCDFEALFLGLPCMIEVRGRSGNRRAIFMKKSKFDRMTELTKEYIVYLYALNEDGARAISPLPIKSLTPFKFYLAGKGTKRPEKPVQLSNCQLVPFANLRKKDGSIMRAYIVVPEEIRSGLRKFVQALPDEFEVSRPEGPPAARDPSPQAAVSRRTPAQ